MNRPARDFWPMVDKSENGCWNWLGYRGPAGYGEIGSRKGNRPTESQTKLAHRVAYELLVGEIPAGLHLDHLCRNTSCVNPEHLEPVTRKENVERGLHGVLRTHCIKGHRFTSANTRINAKDGAKRCRDCARDVAARDRENARFQGACVARTPVLCGVCDRAYGLRLDGLIRSHTISGQRFTELCPGSARPPGASLRTSQSSYGNQSYGRRP
jgi:hypothetical protein